MGNSMPCNIVEKEPDDKRIPNFSDRDRSLDTALGRERNGVGPRLDSADGRLSTEDFSVDCAVHYRGSVGLEVPYSLIFTWLT